MGSENTNPKGEEGGFRRQLNAAVTVDAWEIREEALPSDDQTGVSETLFSIGNGLIGIRGHAEETAAGQNRYERGSKPKVSNRKENCSDMRSQGPLPGSPLRTSAAPRNGSLSISSGVVATRGVFFSGFYEQRRLMHPQAFSTGICRKEGYRLRAPDAFCVDAFLSGVHVSTARCQTRTHTRRLDLRTGELHRRFVWFSPQQHREVTIETRRFVSAARKNISAMHYKMSVKNANNTDVRLISRTFLSAAEYDVESMYTKSNIQHAFSYVCVRTGNSCRHLAVTSVETCSSCSLNVAKSFPSIEGNTPPQGGAEAAFLSTPVTAVPSGSVSSSSPTGVVSPTSLTPSSRETEWGTETSYSSCISDGVSLELVKIVGYFGDEDATQEELLDVATHRTHEAAKLGYEGLLAEHLYVMNQFWETADVQMAPNCDAQGAFRFNILQTYMSASGSPYYCFPTRGLTGDMLHGVQQWDVDALIIPFLSHACPEKAKALLEFRIRTLNEAKDIATDLSLPRGALYPYRTITGEMNPTPYCGAFLFVNAVVVYALKEYVTATNDTSILFHCGGAEMIFSTALVWLEWGSWEKGRFHLRSVSGPDTYNDVADNNFFTNLMAQYHLQWAVQLATLLRAEDPEKWQEVLQRADMTEDDVSAMYQAASKMVLLFDGEHRVHPVDQSFMRRMHWNLSSLKEQMAIPLTQRYHPTVVYRHQVCRIPDVVLSMVLLPGKFSTDEAKADFNFYEGVTASDSALRLAIFSVVTSQLRMRDKAARYFYDALFVDLDNLIGNTSGGLHSTAAAGSWWSMAVGICGMRIVLGVLHFNPILPDEMEEYAFHARHRGCLVRVLVTQRLVTYTLVSAPESNTELMMIHGEANRIILHLNTPETVRLFRETRIFDFDCVIFELDSVVEDIEGVHYLAWTQTLEEYFHDHGFPSFSMTKELYLAYLRHVKPFYGLSEIFKKNDLQPLPVGETTDTATSDTMNGLCCRKLELFRAHVKANGMPLREGVLQLVSLLRQHGIAVGCVTGSKNGHWVINETAMGSSLFDSFIEGKEGEKLGLRWRPEMEYFDVCARRMDAATNRAVAVMDGIDGFSQKAIERFRMVIDVSPAPDEVTLAIPRLLSHNFREITMETLNEYTARVGVVNHLRAL